MRDIHSRPLRTLRSIAATARATSRRSANEQVGCVAALQAKQIGKWHSSSAGPLWLWSAAMGHGRTGDQVRILVEHRVQLGAVYVRHANVASTQRGRQRQREQRNHGHSPAAPGCRSVLRLPCTCRLSHRGTQAAHSRPMRNGQAAQSCERRAPLHRAAQRLLGACSSSRTGFRGTQPPREVAGQAQQAKQPCLVI